jgi:hypothetical protein
MRFIYTAGPYTQFMGRTFAFKRATEVTDRATIEALEKHPDFKRVDPEPVALAPPPPAAKPRATLTLPFRGRSR